MEKEIRIYDLKDLQQQEDDKAFWKSKSPAEHLHALEIIRKSGFKLSGNNYRTDGDQPRFRRVLRVLEQK